MYRPEGDGYLDADNDHDGVVNEDAADDPPDPITFSLDKSDGSNWRLVEDMPNYGTSQPDDFLVKKVLCEHVASFHCTLMNSDLVEIQLTLIDGENELSVKTRAKAMYMD
jgi:hypothetical protein